MGVEGAFLNPPGGLCGRGGERMRGSPPGIRTVGLLGSEGVSGIFSWGKGIASCYENLITERKAGVELKVPAAAKG